MNQRGSLEEITDGKVYGLNDMVKADCNDCKGCSACCQGMGTSIVLDPLDVHRLLTNLNVSFEQLLADRIELNVVDGIVLPNLKMAGTSEACSFLNSEGRCSIHAFRPGICRIFPLGRMYENGSFEYILQVHECPKPNKSKVKVSKWIDTPELKKNQSYIADWHYFVKSMQALVKSLTSEEQIRQASMLVLSIFYLRPYDSSQDFYEQVAARIKNVKEQLGI